MTINGRTTTIEVVQEVNLGSGESSDTRDGPTATCDCGGDGSYDPGDRISVSESSFGEIQTYTTEGKIEPLPFTEGEGSEPTPSSFNVQSSSGTSVQTTSYSSPSPTNTDNDEQTQSSDGGETQEEPDFKILLGSSVNINLADEVVLEPVISGAESDPSDIEYEWSLGDGTTSTDRVVRHVYDEPGTYTVELTVTDPATGETDTDSTTVTVEEGTKDVEKISSDEQQRLADLVEEDPDGDGKVLYLEEGTEYTSLSTISAQDLTIIGQGDDVTLDGPITVTSSGVTMKNVAINGGLIVQNNDFKLYNSEVSNPNGYAVTFNSNGGGFQLGDSKLTGQNGVYVGVDNDVLISNNNIEASDTYGVYTEEAVSNLRIRDNTISSNDIGIYESLAVDGEYKRNTITAPTTLEQQEATAPEINDISAEFTTTDVPLALSTQVNDPDGYGIDEVTWEVNGETYTRHPSNDLIYTFEEPGEYTLTVTVTDQFGKTTTDSKTIAVEEFEASLTTADEASIGDDVTAGVDYNIPEYRVQSIEYNWGDGTSDTVGSSSYSHKYDSKDSYDISVTVNPDEGESRTVTDSITIVDSPVADFAIEDPLIAGESIKFNGAYSTAPDGGSLDYTWEMGDGTTYSQEAPEHTYSSTGTYTVTLTVEGSDGYTESVSAEITLQQFTVDVTPPSSPENQVESEFAVDTSISSSEIDYYIVDFDGDGQGDKQFSSAPFTYTFQEMGERTVTVDAYDHNSYVGRDTVTLDVGAAPLDPSIEVESLNENTLSLMINEAETAPDTNINSIEWSMGDGTTKTGSSISHTYSTEGEYDVSVTVTDDTGDTATTTRTFSVGMKDFFEGLESGNLNEWDVVSGLNAQVTSNRALEGSNSLYIDSGYGDRGSVYRPIPMTDASGPYTFWIYQASDPYDDDSFRFMGDGGTLFSLNVNRETTQDIRVNGDLKNVAFPHGEWTRITVDNVDFDQGTYDWEIVTQSGNTVLSGSANFNSDNMNYVNGFRMHASSHWSGDTGIYYVDNIQAAGSVVELTPKFTSSGAGEVNSLNFDASNSYGGNAIDTYEWSFGDGTTATGETVTHTFPSDGEYDVTLTITDTSGATASHTRTVTVANFQESFENGLGDWTVYNSGFQQTSSPVYSGSYSVGLTQGSVNEPRMASKTLYENGAKPNKLTYHYYETGDSTGGGIRVINSDGQYEMGTATDNPQFDVSSGNGIGEVDSGSGYERWVKVEVTFDWENNQFTYKFTDLSSGRTAQGTEPLRHGKDMATISIEEYHSGTWQAGSNWYMWIDEITVE